MRPALKSVGLALLLVCSTTIALCIPTMNRSPVLAQSTATQDRKAEGDRLFEQGNQQNYTGQIEAAIQSWQQALTLYRAILDLNDEAKVLGNLGEAYRMRSQYDKAIIYYEQELSLYEKGDLSGAYKLAGLSQQSDILSVLGYIFIKMNQYERGIFYYERSVQIYRKLVQDLDLHNIKSDNESLRQAENLKEIALAYQYISKYAKSIDYYNEAAKVYRNLKNGDLYEPELLLEIGRIYFYIGDYKRAVIQFEKVYPILAKQSSYDESDVLMNLGNSYLELGQYEKAIESFEKASIAFETIKEASGEAYVLMSLGNVYRSLMQYEKATIYYQQAQSVFQKEAKRLKKEGVELGFDGKKFQGNFSEASILTELGMIYFLTSKYDESIASYYQALSFFRLTKDRKAEANLLSRIGQLFQRKNSPEIAIVFYKQSVNITESIRSDIRTLSLDQQQSYTKTVANTYRSLADLLIDQGRILEAQQVLELLKVQELKDFDRVTRAKIDNGKIALDPTEQTIVDKYGSFIAFGQKLRECQASNPPCAEYDRFIHLRTAANAEYDQAVKTFEAAIKTRKQQDENNFLNPKNRFGGKVQEILETQPNSALIYSLVTDDKLWLVLATKGEALRQFEVKVSQAELIQYGREVSPTDGTM